MCVFPVSSLPIQPAKKEKVKVGQRCIRPRWNTCSWPGSGDFFCFHQSLELNLPSCFQGLDVIMVQRERSRFPLPGAERKTEKDSTRVCMCVQFPLEAVTQFVLCFSYCIYFLLATPTMAGASQICQWEPDFNVFFCCWILWETSCFSSDPTLRVDSAEDLPKWSLLFHGPNWFSFIKASVEIDGLVLLHKNVSHLENYQSVISQQLVPSSDTEAWC